MCGKGKIYNISVPIYVRNAEMLFQKGSLGVWRLKGDTNNKD